MNCSGKHAGMLVTCALNGWDLATYREPDHPLQQAIAETYAELTGEPVAAVAVDGCGAPLLSASLIGLARAFARLATAPDGAEARVAGAIRAPPGVGVGDPPRRARPADRAARARSARPARSPATPWRCPTGGPSR